MTDNTQELDGIMDKIYDLAYDHLPERGIAIGTDRIKQAILDWHNKQVEEAMAKFHLKKGIKYDVKASDSVIVITHTNKLKESTDE